MLSVREMFPTLQGEGSRAGQPAVFVRFAGCNLWSGLESGRVIGVGECAAWCDTDFARGSKYSADELADAVLRVSRSSGHAHPFVVLTGGEPLLQLNRPAGIELLRRLRAGGAELALETNGTQPLGVAGELLDHITVSPKPLRGAGGSLDHIVARRGTDLKVVVPTPFAFDALKALGAGFQHHYVQPLDTGDKGRSTLTLAIDSASLLGWRVSLQTHKFVELP